MIHLEMLSFDGCVKMSKLCPSIGHLKSLTNLNLRDCESLKELPQEVWLLTSLQELDLFGCEKITALPSQIRNAESLKWPLLEILDLGFRRNLISSPDFTSMPHLQTLRFSGCEKMTELDPSIGQLKRLTDLDLWECESLKELPQEIGQLTSLKELSLSGCSSLKEVPQEVWQLTSLTTLDFSGCSKITIGNAESLKLPLPERLDLSNCSDLISCPDFTCMPHLQKLSFRGCEKIADLDPSIRQLKRLMRLDLWQCKSLKELPKEIGQLTLLEELTLTGCSSLKEVLTLPPSLNKLNASHCNQLESMADVSNLKGLETLDLSRCTRLEDIAGIEQLKCLKRLLLGGCRSLADSLFARAKEANFQHLEEFSIPGRLINDGSSDPHSIAFILPKQFYSGLLCLYVDQKSMDNIWLERFLARALFLFKIFASEDEVEQPVDSQLGRSIVRVDIRTNDAQFSFTTFFNRWDSPAFPMATFARDGELMMMADQGRFKGNDVDDAQGRGMMEMCVSLDSCVLLHGDLRLTKQTFIGKEDLVPCGVGRNIVRVKFG